MGVSNAWKFSFSVELSLKCQLAIPQNENILELYGSFGKRRSDTCKITTAQVRKEKSLLFKFSNVVKGSDRLSGTDYSVYLT